MLSIPAKLRNLLIITLLVRIVVAAVVELSNDEVYYYLYALDLQPNYFDHPPGVGILIRLFTGNLFFTNELFVRLGAIICAAIGTILVYHLGLLIKNERTGWYAAILYNTSIYTSIITGTFIIPDSPQVIFWLASVFVAFRILVNAAQGMRGSFGQWVLFGLLTGLCALCKVHGVFIWFGLGIYILFYQRSILKDPGLYASAMVALITVSPILIWNIQNDFITYRFHSERVAVQESVFHFDYLVQALAGQIVYNNPINSILIFIAVWKWKSIRFLDTLPARFLLLSGLPIILVVSAMSLFNSMLPHWSGPGFMILAFVAAAWLDEKTSQKAALPKAIRSSAWLVGISLLSAVLLIKMYPGTFGSHERNRYGDGDFTLDMAGWKEFGEEFGVWVETQKDELLIPRDIKIVSHKWFPAAHLEYYVASPSGLTLVGVGKVTDLHQYFWLNKKRPGLMKGDQALCIVPSNYGMNLEASYLQAFVSADLLTSFESKRSGKVARYFDVYLLKDYQMNDEVHVDR